MQGNIIYITFVPSKKRNEKKLFNNQKILVMFKDLNALVNSSAWNKAREVNEDKEFTHDQMYDILDYVNNGLSEDADRDEQISVILEAMDRVPSQWD